MGEDRTMNSQAGALVDFNRLWNYGNPAETERKFRELLPAAEARGDVSYLLQLETQIARAMGLQGRFAECHGMLDGVERRMTPELSVVRVRYLLERGRAFNSANEAARAEPLFVEAWKVASEIGEWNYAVDAAHMVAIADSDLAAQVKWNQTALVMVEQHPETKRWRSALYNNLGEAYRAQGEYALALECFRKCAEVDREAGRQADVFTTKDIAKMLRLLGRVDEAMVLIEPIAMRLTAEGAPDGYISAEYGQCLLALGRGEEAKPFLVQAYQMLRGDSYMVAKEPGELQHLKELSGE